MAHRAPYSHNIHNPLMLCCWKTASFLETTWMIDTLSRPRTPAIAFHSHYPPCQQRLNTIVAGCPLYLIGPVSQHATWGLKTLNVSKAPLQNTQAHNCSSTWSILCFWCVCSTFATLFLHVSSPPVAVLPYV